jgi:hypothetical protein
MTRKLGYLVLVVAMMAMSTSAFATTYAPGSAVGSDFVLGPTTPGKWGPAAFGTGATVTWSLMPTGTSCAAEFAGCTISHLDDFMPVGYLGQITAALAAWSAVADLTFVQVSDDGAAFNTASPDAGNRGNLRFGGHAFDGAFGTLAHGYYPPANGASAAGDMHYDTGDAWDLVFDGTGDGAFSIFQVTAHEIGHALGLDHTAVPNSLMNPFYTEAFSGPQADDIAGMQFIYGKATTPPPTPEPSSLMTLGLALVGIAVASRKLR